MGTASNVLRSGPGHIWVAATSATEPSAATTSALGTGFRDVGYTDSGITISMGFGVEPVEVAEERQPIGYEPVGGTTTASWAFAEDTAENLAVALNLGDSYTTGAIEPPDLGDEVRIMIVHQTNAGALWILRQCINGGTAELASSRAPQKKLIAVTFNLEKPDAAAPFKVIPAADGTI